jgi:acetyl esterase/lipase
MMRGLASLVIGVTIALLVGGCSPRAQPITYAELLARARPAPDHRIAYGAAPDEFGELWLPTGAGRHPVVVLIHGGCWQASLPGLQLMTYAAVDLRRRGFVVWNVEYRRLGEDGGGYPGTFLDIARSVDFLRTLAPTYPLDLHHVVLVAHSAGGQLALWAAAQRHLPKASPLVGGNSQSIAGVVTLAGFDDLEDYRRAGSAACGGSSTIDDLVAGKDRPTSTLFSDTSPARLLPIGVPQTIISGELDPIVPEIFGGNYAMKAQGSGDKVQSIVIPASGHFDLIDPQSAAWRTVEAVIARMAQ